MILISIYPQKIIFILIETKKFLEVILDRNLEEKDQKLILTEDLELHIIEIPKIYRTEGKEELEKWNFTL